MVPAASPVRSAKATPGHATPAAGRRYYRLVDQEGAPHPILDDLYDSLDAAWSEAVSWWQENGQGQGAPAIGVEVSTGSGAWRSLRPPGS